METTSNISEKIRQIRLQKGLSQENMADMLGLSTTAYGDLERGRTEVSVSRLNSISKVLDVGVQELLGFDSERISETDWLRQENLRLQAVNQQLQKEVELLKSRWAALAGEIVIREIRPERQKIGF